jgi:nitronate monooxygenase
MGAGRTCRSFLNHGRGWVVRKLRELLPRVRDNSLHTDLSEMLRSHEANIALATEVFRSAA